MSQQVNFRKIRAIIEKLEASVGLYLLKDSPVEKTFKERIRSYIVSTQIFFVSLLLLTTVIITDFELISIILCISMVLSQINLHSCIIQCKRKKHVIRNIFRWCEDLYDVQRKFPESLHRTCELRLRITEKRTLLVIKWMGVLFSVDAIAATVGYAFVGLFLPESIYPKYSAPLPYYLPFKQQNTIWSFIITVSVQTFVCFYSLLFISFLYSIFFCILIHILEYMNIIHEFIKNVKKDLKRDINQLALEDEQPTSSTSTLQREVLAAINVESHNNSNQTEFNKSIKIITEMINEVNAIIETVAEITKHLFLMLEIASLCTFFISGLMITVLKQQYIFAIGITCVNVLLFIDCYANEKILDKFEEIRDALYDIPWYDLDVKKRKMLLIALNCDKIQKGLNASGIHVLTLERFGIIVKAGYTNLLVLKDLIEK